MTSGTNPGTMSWSVPSGGILWNSPRCVTTRFRMFPSPLGYGLLLPWDMAYCSLWAMAYCSLWAMAYCSLGLSSTAPFGLLPTAPFGLWPMVIAPGCCLRRLPLLIAENTKFSWFFLCHSLSYLCPHFACSHNTAD